MTFDTSSVMNPGSLGVSGLWLSDSLTWVTQPGVISPWFVCKQRTTPRVSLFDPQPPLGLSCSFTDVPSGFSQLQTSNTKEPKCLVKRLPWKTPAPHINRFTAGPPHISSADLHQLEVLSPLLLVGLARHSG